MGRAAEQTRVKCQNCKKSIAMLFPNSSCDCVGGSILLSYKGYKTLLLRICVSIFNRYKLKSPRIVEKDLQTTH